MTGDVNAVTLTLRAVPRNLPRTTLPPSIPSIFHRVFFSSLGSFPFPHPYQVFSTHLFSFSLAFSLTENTRFPSVQRTPTYLVLIHFPTYRKCASTVPSFALLSAVVYGVCGYLADDSAYWVYLGLLWGVTFGSEEKVWGDFGLGYIPILG